MITTTLFLLFNPLPLFVFDLVGTMVLGPYW